MICRSFEPILRLLRVLSISWQAQYWAVWALANLTRVHSKIYPIDIIHFNFFMKNFYLFFRQ